MSLSYRHLTDYFIPALPGNVLRLSFQVASLQFILSDLESKRGKKDV